MRPLFNRASSLIRQTFGGRVQKIPIDAGFSCPNRDGTLSTKGCLYCCNRSFAPFYTDSKKSITEQLHLGIDFFSKKYNCQQFFAYFQSFSNTYAPIDVLKKKYHEAIDLKNLTGLVISTRPDCISNEIVELLKDTKKKKSVRIEIGVESFNNEVLEKINRCHNSEVALTAVKMLISADIPVSIHLISGLPGEKKDYMSKNAQIINEIGVDIVKLHHLQIVKGSEFATEYEKSTSTFRLMTLESYIDAVCEFISWLSPSIYLERFINRVPVDSLLAPRFGAINESQFQIRLEKRLLELNLFQGCKLGNKY